MCTRGKKDRVGSPSPEMEEGTVRGRCLRPRRSSKQDLGEGGNAGPSAASKKAQ